MTDKFNEECAIVGVVGEPEAAKYCYLALYAMQHRGQEGSGIVSTDEKSMFIHRDMGLVSDVFEEQKLAELNGGLAVGHNRYATYGSKDKQNLQPLVANFADNAFAIAHNGNLINSSELREELERNGAIFSTTSDTESILHLVARASTDDPIAKRIAQALAHVRGAYSLVVMTKHRLLAVRDPAGVRPLMLGKMDQGYIVASETCAFDLVGAEFVREIEPGEILEITADGKQTSTNIKNGDPSAFCVFEYVYFSRPDSVIGGKSVYLVRKAMGAELAKEHGVEADIVIPVPDSGVPAAIGYAQEIGLPLELGLIRNHYVGRTFIEPSQSIRDFGVKIKLNASGKVLDGKKVVVVDDSLVRGTTSKKIVAMLRRAGAKEIHFRLSSPPTTGSCYYGIDTPSKEELIAANKSIEETCKFIGADTLAYLSNEGMFNAVQTPKKNFCDACFSGEYKLGKPASGNLASGNIDSEVNKSGSTKPSSRVNGKAAAPQTQSIARST